MPRKDEFSKNIKNMSQVFLRIPAFEAIIANFLIISVIIFAQILNSKNYVYGYLIVQEDQIIEWMTFWSFFLASLVSIWAMVRQKQSENVVPWFLFFVAVFCMFVAMEEISWGQRLFGYLPPSYFLEQNF